MYTPSRADSLLGEVFPEAGLNLPARGLAEALMMLEIERERLAGDRHVMGCDTEASVGADTWGSVAWLCSAKPSHRVLNEQFVFLFVYYCFWPYMTMLEWDRSG